MLSKLARFGPRCSVLSRATAKANQWHHYALPFAEPGSSLRRDPARGRSTTARAAAGDVEVDEGNDTIAALSSGSGRCGVALLRVSGPRAGKHAIALAYCSQVTKANVDDCMQTLSCIISCRIRELCLNPDERFVFWYSSVTVHLLVSLTLLFMTGCLWNLPPCEQGTS